MLRPKWVVLLVVGTLVVLGVAAALNHDADVPAVRAVPYVATSMPGLFLLPADEASFPQALAQLMRDHPNEHCRYMGTAPTFPHRVFLYCEQPPEQESPPREPESHNAQDFTVP